MLLKPQAITLFLPFLIFFNNYLRGLLYLKLTISYLMFLIVIYSYIHGWGKATLRGYRITALINLLNCRLTVRHAMRFQQVIKHGSILE
jgi:hypothetical protein